MVHKLSVFIFVYNKLLTKLTNKIRNLSNNGSYDPRINHKTYINNCLAESNNKNKFIADINNDVEYLQNLDFSGIKIYKTIAQK